MDKNFVLLLTVFILVFGLFTSLMIFNKPINTITRAKEELITSPSKSLIFAWPLEVSSEGKKESIINVFVRNEKGTSITDRKVTLNTNFGTIQDIQAISDKQGKAVFKIFSNTEGIANIEATVDNSIRLIQKITVQFTK